jgi:diguanylate cyclase (GGDEF)-like protein
MPRAADSRGADWALGRARRLAESRGLGVWVLTLLVGAASVALLTTVVSGVAPVSGVRLPWWVLAPAFLVAEATVVHLHFRRDAHSFTLSEVPLAFALAAAAPVEAIAGRLVGGTAVVLFRGGRRFNPAKACFNIALFALEITAAVAIFHAVGGGASIGRAVPAVLLAAGTVSALATVLVAVAMRVSGAELGTRDAGVALGIAIAVALTNACLGLVGIATLSVNPWLVALLSVPALAVFLGYRAHLAERRRRRHFEFLLETTRLVQRSADLEVALAALLAHVADAFRSAFVQITLVSPEGDGSALRSTRHQDGRIETMVPVTLDAAALDLPARATAFEGIAARERYGLRDAIVAPLRGERVIGSVLVGDREGDVTTFDGDDVALFETFGAHVGVALENERLGASLQRLQDLQDELRHQASHDALTGLPNRVFFSERVQAALAASPPTGVAVLFVDVDDFKNVNDTIGHSAGDALLVAVAKRLRASVDSSDTVARFGGDEFAVLIGDARDVARSAPAVAARVVRALSEDVALGGGVTAAMSASVGVAIARRGETVEEFLRHADVAMYRAKALGKARHVVFEPEPGEQKEDPSGSPVATADVGRRGPLAAGRLAGRHI